MRRMTWWMVGALCVGCGSPSTGDDKGDTPTDTDAPSDTDTTVDTDTTSTAFDPDVAPVSTGTWWRPGASDTWHWQLQGEIDTTYAVDVYDIDLFDTPKATITALHDDGRKVLCYFSAGSWEDWRDDASAFPEALRGHTLDGYEDEKWMDVSNVAIQAPMLARLKLAKSKGCDGVEPDNVTAFNNDTGFTLTASDQLAFNRWLFNAAHEEGLAVFLKNDTDQADDLVAYVDGTVNEQCHEYDECDTLAAFVTAGKPIFNAEFKQSYRDDPTALCALADTADTHTLVLDVDLDNSFVFNCDTDVVK